MQSQSTQNNQRKKRHIWGLLFSIAILGFGLYFWSNFQYFLDLYNYQTYNPSAAVASITKNSRLTDEGRFAFYTAQPAIDGTRAFNVKCDRKEENTAILGCYTANKIYIFEVTDERLNGIREVTAVHEMLHVIYQRASADDRAKLRVLLDAEAKKLEKDKDFSERMAFYARTEPGERYNELHSIIGTEVSSVSGELESYYDQYFDRQHIVGLFKLYKSEFKKLETKASKMKTQIDALSKKIDKAKDKYASDVKALDRDIVDFNSQAESGTFESQSQFDSERASLVARADQIKQQQASINLLLKQYNDLIKQHNDIITESNKLYQSIDSSLAPAPSV